jgi:alpha-D-ribose 1-methylphosphonate 5-triphosphate diphosphatase
MLWIIKNGSLVLKDRILEQASLLIKDGIIQNISTGDSLLWQVGAEVCDAKGMYVLPGMIDIHSDAIEKEIEPRPDTSFPVELAILQLEKRLVSQGFTSVFHSLSFAGGEGVRDDRNAEAIINQLKRPSWSQIRNLVHLRYEITNFESLQLVKKLLHSGMVDLFSIMDHSPGQGQYQTLESYANYIRKTYRLPESRIKQVAEERIQRREKISAEFLEELIKTASALNIPTASHDDDSIEKINWIHKIGISIAEFPINMATAEQAAKLKMFVPVGAPNIARGCSHNGNLSAMDLIKAGYANVICSDYYPGSMLYAVFQVAAELNSLVQAVKMVSLNPAIAVGQDDRLGSIEVGKQADLIIVDNEEKLPVVKKTFIHGRLVYSGDYWNQEVQAEVS